MWHLEYVDRRDGRRRRVAVDALPFRVGRCAGIGLVLETSSVSRLHAELVDRGGMLWLRDLGSRNGTFVNGTAIQQAALGDGDVIHFADLEVRLARSDAGERSAAEHDRTVILSAAGCGARRAETLHVGSPALDGYAIGEPRSFENLSAYVVTGADVVQGLAFCTLQHALRLGRAVVHETGSVGLVVVENLTADAIVFLQSGDIVKGGRQDRAVRFDTLVQPRARVETQAYCVERSRWHGRGGEDHQTFSGSDTIVPTAAMRTTILRGLGQADVWSTIEAEQDRLSATIGGSVRSAQSPTSYQLTAENEKVKQAIGGYLAALDGLADVERAVGAVLAVNGALNRADLYATADLFRDLWPKLLEAAAIEALARRPEWEAASPPAPPAVGTVRSYLERSRHGSGTQVATSPDVLSTRIVGEGTTFCETRLLRPRETWVHHGYVTYVTARA